MTDRRIALGLALALAIGCGGKGTGPGSAVSTGPTPGSTPGRQWKEFTSKEWGFRAAFPSRPAEVPAAGPPIPAARSVRFAAEMGDNVFVVSVADLPPAEGQTEADVQRRFDDAEQRLVLMFAARVRERKRITLQGKYPGQEILADVTADGQKSQHHGRTYLVGSRSYSLVAYGDVSPADAAAFFDSFKVLE
jgi:hypothetical protein